MFHNEPVVSFKGKKNLKVLIVSDRIKYSKVKKHTSIMNKGKYSLYLVNNRTLCQQVYYFNANSKYANILYTYIHMTPEICPKDKYINIKSQNVLKL